MAYISKRKYNTGHHEFEVKVYYTSSKGWYAKGIDQNLIDCFPESREQLSKVQSEGDIYGIVNTLVRDYIEGNEKERKVIVCNLVLSNSVISKIGKEYRKFEPGFHSRFYGKGLSIDWDMKYIIERAGDEYVQEIVMRNGIEERGRTHKIHDRTFENKTVIEWSEDRQSWFESIDKAILEMSKNVANFFSLSEGEITQMIDSGQMLLNR